MRKLFAALLVIVSAIVGSTSTAFGENAPQSWIPYGDPVPGFHSITYADNSTLKFNFSVLQSSQPSGMILCTSTKDPACAGNYSFVYNSILKTCASQTEVDCVDSLAAQDATGNAIPATFSHYTVDNHPNSYPADPAIGLPAGGMPGVWSIPSLPHNGSTDYVVIAGVQGATSGPIPPNSKYFGETVAASIIPVKLYDFGNLPNATNFGSSYTFDYCNQIQQTATVKNIGCGHVLGPGCLFPTNNSGKCYVQDSFPPDTKYSLKIRFSREPNGWLHGRMTDPDIQLSSAPNNVPILSVTAGPANVPLIYQSGMWANLSPEIQNFWVRCMNDHVCGLASTQLSGPDYYSRASTLAGNAGVNVEMSVYSSGDSAIAGIGALAPVIGDKATVSNSSWSFRSLPTDEVQGTNNCFQSNDGMKGIVTTNSTAYSAGPPAFKEGSLNYQVASPHFNPDGTIFKGTYNLVMKSSVARCLYKFSSAPISASISVISSDGSNDVATTVANESGGWLHLSANNFTFSSPTVKVKLTQEAPTPTPVVTSSPTPSATQPAAPVAASKKSTITCIKGKSTKSVTATKPTCPTGYKKK